MAVAVRINEYMRKSSILIYRILNRLINPCAGIQKHYFHIFTPHLTLVDMLYA
jgi:hypothetical protein